jgi:putative transcriptional regulator
VRPFGDETPNLSGHLLLAHPSMRDPNFRRTILFLSAYDKQDGAFGLVINRPTNKRLVDFLPGQELGVLENVPVYHGGPVEPHELIIASFQWTDVETKITMHSAWSLNELEELPVNERKTLRAFVGYSGWTGGQLEAELQQDAWIVQAATKTILNGKADEGTWLKIMRTLGPAYHLLAIAPDHPELN